MLHNFKIIIMEEVYNTNDKQYLFRRNTILICRCGEMADAQDSKSCDGNIMSVRPRPPAPPKIFYFIHNLNNL